MKAKAEAELAKQSAELDQQIQIAQIQAKRAAEMEDAVLQRVNFHMRLKCFLFLCPIADSLKPIGTGTEARRNGNRETSRG